MTEQIKVDIINADSCSVLFKGAVARKRALRGSDSMCMKIYTQCSFPRARTRCCTLSSCIYMASSLATITMASTSTGSAGANAEVQVAAVAKAYLVTML